jgi:SAM-dependent methyltransferase
MRPEDFERRYRVEQDPWAYRTSRYEQAKYAATLEACGPGPFRSALELGGSIGVFSAMLAPRCRQLTTIDFSPTAVSAARARLAPHPQATAILGSIPEALAPGARDLVVASEVLYYLDPPALRRTLETIERMLEPGGRIVCVHWRPDGPDRPLDAASVHSIVRAQPWLRVSGSGHTQDYLLDVLDRA